jgi:hypothetical protein
VPGDEPSRWEWLLGLLVTPRGQAMLGLAGLMLGLVGVLLAFFPPHG